MKWLRCNEEIKEDDRYKIVTHEDGNNVDSVCSITTFCPNDVGKITCRASNIYGSAQTSCELLVQLITPSFVHLLPKSTEVDEGGCLELKAKIDGSPMPEISWYKDGEKIVPDEHTKIETLPDGTSKLIIDCVKPLDCGAYKLVINNSTGEHSSLCAVAIKRKRQFIRFIPFMPKIRLNSNDYVVIISAERRKPSFSKSLEDVKIVVGQPLKLEAQVVAFPNPEVQWFKNGIPLRQTKEMYFINEPIGMIGLRIDSCRPEDAGTYSMTVSNSLGETTGTAKVEIEEKETRPEFVVNLQPLSVMEGFPAKMEVKVLGKPTPRLQWFKNGEEVQFL